MAHHSGPLRPPPMPPNNGLSSEDSPCVMSSEDSHAVGPFGEPYRTTPPCRKAPNQQLQAVFLRLSLSHGLSNALNPSSHTPSPRPAPELALPTPAPRARRTYSFRCSRGAHTISPRASLGHKHMRHEPTRTAQAATHTPYCTGERGSGRSIATSQSTGRPAILRRESAKLLLWYPAAPQ